jgi:heme oxygenase
MNQMKIVENQERAPIDLFAMLKSETSVVHEKVMEEAWAQKVLSSGYTRDEYFELLQKYYGFYLPLETRLLTLPASVFSSTRAKHRLLEEDLNFLVSTPRTEKPFCARLPEIVDAASALGVCYVLEGATLGGQIIAKHLKLSLGLQEQAGLRFFYGYGAETGKRWREFKTQTREIVRTPEDSAVMLEAALKTFQYLSDWMVTS